MEAKWIPLTLSFVTWICAIATITNANPALPRQGRCEPFDFKSVYRSWQEHCEYVSSNEVTDSDADELFAAMPPITEEREFPLAGCVLGCPVGHSWKAFVDRKDTEIFQRCFLNLMEDGVPVGVALKSGGQGEEVETKEITVGESWSSSVRRKGRGLGVWTILYDGDGYSGRILGGNFTVVREEMKQGARNSVSVKVFAKVEMDSGETGYTEYAYTLAQACREDGTYHVNLGDISTEYT